MNRRVTLSARSQHRNRGCPISPETTNKVKEFFGNVPSNLWSRTCASFYRRPESPGFRFRSAPPPPSGCAPQNRRTHAAPDSSLSLSLQTLPLRFLAHLLRLRCSVSLLSLCASGPPQMGDRSTPGLSGGETRHRGPRVSPLYSPLAHPCAQDCELSIPLERLRLETHRLALPRWRSLDEFLNPPLHSAFCSVRSPPLSPTGAARPNAPFRSRILKFTSEPRNHLRVSFMLHAHPSAKHEARQPRRSAIVGR